MVGSTSTPGFSSRKRAAELRRNGRCCGKPLIAASSAGGEFEIDSWMNGRATLASAVNVVSRFTNSDACVSATGATSAPRPERLEEARELRVRVGQVLRHRLQVDQERPQVDDRLVDVVAAPGERGAEAVEAALRAAPGLHVEGVEDLVDLDRLGRGLRGRDRVAGLKPSSDSPGVISTYLRPSAERGRMIIVESHRQRIDLLLELQLDLGASAARRRRSAPA